MTVTDRGFFSTLKTYLAALAWLVGILAACLICWVFIIAVGLTVWRWFS